VGNVVTATNLKQKEIKAMVHNNTVLAQLLNLIDKHDFQKLENRQFKPQTIKLSSRYLL